MSDDSFPELEFPLLCHYKVIAEKKEDLKPALVDALKSIGIEETLEAGRTSAGGRYVSYNLSITVNDRDAMVHVDRTLRAVEGVKMVL